MTTSDSVVAMTARPISAVASIAASFGETPFSSTYLKMFSSTTIASSMTMPVASESASIVMLFSVKPSGRMNVNVPMIEIGIASPAMIVTRQLRMNRNTTTAARMPPKIRWCWISSNDLRMKTRLVAAWLARWMSGGSVGLDPLEARQHAVDDFDGVGARLLADRQRDRVHAVQTGLAARFFDRVGDARDVADADDRAVADRRARSARTRRPCAAGPSSASRFPTARR